MAVIEVRKFAKKFGQKLVHKNVNFSVHRGECLGLIGGSGVGKSVVLRSLIGLEKPDQGEILIEGQSIIGLSENDLVPIRRKVAYVFQNGALFDSMSVFENLAYPLREHTKMTLSEIREKVREQLDDWGLGGSEKLFPSELSGGMQKRVGLLRSTILNPEVILYDEPTAGLDPYNTIKIQETVLRLKKRGVTSIIVTHDMPTAFAVCDRMCLLANGEVGAVGTVDELQNDRNGPLRRFTSGMEE
ncbi:MAG: ABC transporter ATP-binding protein [Bdellovibrionales bacterium]